MRGLYRRDHNTSFSPRLSIYYSGIRAYEGRIQHIYTSKQTSKEPPIYSSKQAYRSIECKTAQLDGKKLRIL